MERLIAVQHVDDTPLRTSKIDLSMAGWLLIVAGIWEILFNRLASAIGLYSNVGAAGFLSWLAASGRLAMNTMGIMALVLICASLPRLASDQRFAPLSTRVILMLSSPFFLPIVCVAIFRRVSPELIFFGYLVAAGTAVFTSILIALIRIDSSRRRLVIALGMIQLLAAFEIVARVASLFHSADFLEAVPHRAYLLSEVLFVVTPIAAFLMLRPGRLLDFLKRPHLLGLASAGVALGVAIFTTNRAADEAFIKLIAYRTIGVTIAIPGGVAWYITALFLGTLLIGSLVLPSKRWPPSADSRRTGFGLACIWLAGVQPTNPYQFVTMLLGFFYLARGFLGEPSNQPLIAAALSTTHADGKN